MTELLQINLLGACIVRSGTDAGYQITGSKHRALFALLATAPFGGRTRSYLQNLLCGTSCHVGGRQSLRTVLSVIKSTMDADFETLLKVNNTEICLDLAQVDFLGLPGSAEFRRASTSVTTHSTTG